MQTYYNVLDAYVPPEQLDNSQLLTNRPIQLPTSSNCVVISVCNICEAKYWQHSGIKIKFDYEAVFDAIDCDKTTRGIKFEDIQQILDFINPAFKPLRISKSFSYTKNSFKHKTEFTNTLKSTIHKYQFFTLASHQLATLCNNNHAVTICGYTLNGFIAQTTYEADDRFVVLPDDKLFASFASMQSFDIDWLVAD